jgi:hypothetical protein
MPQLAAAFFFLQPFHRIPHPQRIHSYYQEDSASKVSVIQ